jgi:hypothetical protein
MNTQFFNNHKRFGIFGASESGKSTLAKKISAAMWANEKRPTIVLDPVSKSNWGNHAKVFTNEESFWKYIFLPKVRNCLVIVDDASVTINRDSELNGVFTVLRHQQHKLLVIGHSANNLLPQMRDQIQRIFLFLQNRQSVEKWANVFPQAELEQATNLQQYEFITYANYCPLQKFKLSK